MREQINDAVLGEYFIGSVEPYLRSAVAQLVECLTGDRRVASSRLTAGRVTVLCPLARHFSAA